MKISRWKGLVSAASPYSVPAGAATLQNNLQIRKPGQLIPRPGIEAIDPGSGEPLLAIHRTARGTTLADVLVAFYYEESDSAPGAENPVPDRYYLKRLTPQSGGGFDVQTLFTSETAPYSRPTFCEDRHGTLFVFFGNGIRPLAYRPAIDTQAVPFGLDAPTVAPDVTPAGDGWFIERVDVLASGTSYFTAPTITVTGGSPARNAVLRGVVQAGSLVAVDVVDGGSNFKAMPTFKISNEQLGTGFVGRGNLVQTQGVFGFTSNAEPAATGSNPSSAGFTAAYNLDTNAPTIAYTGPSGTAFVTADLDLQTGNFTAILPLTTASGPGFGAFARILFSNTSAAYRPGNVAPLVPTGETLATVNFTTSVISTAAQVQVKRRSSLYTGTVAGNYYENTFSPASAGIEGWYSQHYTANRDRFWALSPRPLRYRFGKSQTYLFGVQPGGFWGNNRVHRQWGDYYYPDYTQVSYYLLTGPESGFAQKANWTRAAASVQLDGSGRPFVDIGLLPCKRADGTAFPSLPGTVNPSVRVYLAFCPDSWLVNNTPPFGDPEGRRYQPYNGQDRTATFSSNPLPLHNGGQDQHTHWWSIGHAPNFPLSRPIVDIRQNSSSDTIGLTADSIQLLGQGALLTQGTKFALRFVQYNAADYRLAARAQDLTWLNAGVISSTGAGSGRRFLQVTEAVWNQALRGTWGQNRTDFYFEANTLDSSPAAVALSRPGVPLLGAASGPKCTITGEGWTAQGQTALVEIRHRADTGSASGDSAAFTPGQTFTFTTVTLIEATVAKRIGSVVVLSGGQNYFREPTILSSGGGGYGLRLGATVANGQVQTVAVLEGGDGFVSDTQLLTDVQPAKLMPVLRGTMRGTYRCAYRFADYRQTEVRRTTFTTRSPLDGSRVIQLTDVTGVKPGMAITGSSAIRHMTRIVSLQGNNATLSLEPLAARPNLEECVIRDMERPVTYSDFSPIANVDASASGSGRASTLQWALAGVSAPGRADHVEFFRTSADQSLVFYRLEIVGLVDNGVITFSSPTDGLSDEELFDLDRPNYAALPVVLPNGSVNAFRFGVARSDMAVAVAWQDRLWFGVSTSGADANTVYYSELDEFESCPDVNDLPIQVNLRTTDYLTALVPFGSVLMAMQNSHAYTVTFNTDPSVDAAVTLAAHRGALSQQCWDFYDETLYIADERGVYSMDRSGNVKSLSEPIRDFFDEGRLDLTHRNNFFLKVDHSTGMLRLFAVATGSGAEYPHFALCLHISNETWWTESWPTALLSATDYRESGQQDRPVYGGVDGSAMAMRGLTDEANRDIVAVTVTNPGSGYVVPPAVTIAGQGAAQFQAIVRNGQVVEILLLYGGWGYGTATEDPNNNNQVVFDSTVTLTIAAPPAGGVQATATAQARLRIVNEQVSQSSVPWRMRTGPLELMNDTNTRKGDAEFSRSVTVTYRPTQTAVTLNLREHYNNSDLPRVNVMRRDRGTGFVHDTAGGKTTLDMRVSRSALGVSTGLATAQFAGRSLGDLASADRHLAVELSCDSVSADDPAVAVSEPLIYAIEVSGVLDGGE